MLSLCLYAYKDYAYKKIKVYNLLEFFTENIPSFFMYQIFQIYLSEIIKHHQVYKASLLKSHLGMGVLL